MNQNNEVKAAAMDRPGELPAVLFQGTRVYEVIRERGISWTSPQNFTLAVLKVVAELMQQDAAAIVARAASNKENPDA